MDEIKRKKPGWSRRRNRRRIWAAFSILWLVTACLAGCAPSGGSGGQKEAQQTVGEPETRLEEAAASVVNPPGAGEAPDGKELPETGEAPGGNGLSETGEAPDGKELPGAGEASDGKELPESGEREPALTVEESGSYTSKEEVALYIHLYGHLPGNYITKKQAEELGWDSRAGNLWEVAPGMSIGGSRFGNYEGALPDKEGRKYYECDIDYDGGYRGAKRIIYSDDGLIFYTEDHYKTFEELYGQ